MADEKKEKKFYLYNRINSTTDGSGFSFFIDGGFLQVGQKVKLVFVKRAKGHKRVDMGLFYMDYRTFRSFLSIIEHKMRAGKLLKDKDGKETKNVFEESFYGGTDGKRRLHVTASRSTIFFNCYDNIIKTEHDDYKTYTGSIMFSIKGALDLQELFDIKTTLSNWEISNINKFLKPQVKNDPDKTEASK
jgi:hypothetical protein